MENTSLFINSKIITPYDSRIEYKYENNKIFYYKTLKNNMRFPYSYSIIEEACASDFLPLKNIIYFKEIIYPGTYIKTKIIGGVKFIGPDGIFHERILSIPFDCEENDIVDLEHFCLEEIKLFIIQYYKINSIKINFTGFVNRDEGITIYRNACIRYESKQAKIDKENTKKSNKNIFKVINKFFSKKKNRIGHSPLSDISSNISSSSD